jgi:hypothetical protein
VKLPARPRWPPAVGRSDLAVMSAAFCVFGLSLIFQSTRWHATPAYHVLLLILPAQSWGALFLASGLTMGLAAWQFTRRWVVIAALVLAFTLTTGWALSFVVRYLTSPSTTPETWVSWAIFDFLLIKVAVSLDRGPPLRAGAEAGDFRRAVDAALAAAEEAQRAAVLAAVLAAVDAGAAQRREDVSAAESAYRDALRAIIPAATAAADPALRAITEARETLRRAEEAYERATGVSAPVPPQDDP